MIALLDKITKSFPTGVLYSNLTLQINAGERWALVGPNGSGKTTLLRILMRQELPDEGRIAFAKNVRIGYLDQELSFSGANTVLQEVLSSAHEIQNLEHSLKKLSVAISAQATHNQQSNMPDEKLLQKLMLDYSEAQERFEHLGGYELESTALRILGGLGFEPADAKRSLEEFSGGWKMRIALAKLLLKQPDLLLLDEPTNHLDLESVRWLKGFLASYEGSILLISHDRHFMDACVSHVASLENKLLRTYVGNYSSYLKQREDNLQQLRAKRAAQEREMAHLQTFIDRFRYTDTKARQAQERVKRLEKLKQELVVLPEQSATMHFTFPDPPRTGETIIQLQHITHSYDDQPVFTDVTINLYRGDKVALVGPNGAGKSTLLKIIAEKINPSAGNICFGAHVVSAYYAQHQIEQLSPANSALQELDTVARNWTTQEERKLLGAFLFHGDDVNKKVSVLSGGERARLALAKMLVHARPLFLLDEPTNHLDIDSVDLLEQALVSFKGSIVLVSHDEHLVRAVATKIIDIRNHQVTLYDGDYDYYLYKRAELEGVTAEAGATPTIEAGSSSRATTATDAKSISAIQTRTGSQQNYKTAGSMGMHTSNPRGVNKQAVRSSKPAGLSPREIAERRNYRNRMLKPYKTKLEESEHTLNAAQSRYNSLMERMADEELYQNKEAFAASLAEYNELAQSLPKLEEAWLQAAEEFEAKEAQLEEELM